MITEYDPLTCINVRELRALGADMGDLPNCAWVPRISMHLVPGGVVISGLDAVAAISITFSVPFRWIATDPPAPDMRHVTHLAKCPE